jgi:hypothetical protein
LKLETAAPGRSAARQPSARQKASDIATKSASRNSQSAIAQTLCMTIHCHASLIAPPAPKTYRLVPLVPLVHEKFHFLCLETSRTLFSSSLGLAYLG